MSIRVSPIHPGRAYAVFCNGKKTVVMAAHGIDAACWFLENILECK